MLELVGVEESVSAAAPAAPPRRWRLPASGHVSRPAVRLRLAPHLRRSAPCHAAGASSVSPARTLHQGGRRLHGDPRHTARSLWLFQRRSGRYTAGHDRPPSLRDVRWANPVRQAGAAPETGRVPLSRVLSNWVAALTDVRLTAWIAFALFVLSAWPLLLVDLPPFQDLPNHVATAHIVEHPELVPAVRVQRVLQVELVLGVVVPSLRRPALVPRCPAGDRVRHRAERRRASRVLSALRRPPWDVGRRCCSPGRWSTGSSCRWGS